MEASVQINHREPAKKSETDGPNRESCARGRGEGPWVLDRSLGEPGLHKSLYARDRVKTGVANGALGNVKLSGGIINHTRDCQGGKEGGSLLKRKTEKREKDGNVRRRKKRGNRRKEKGAKRMISEDTSTGTKTHATEAGRLCQNNIQSQSVWAVRTVGDILWP